MLAVEKSPRRFFPMTAMNNPKRAWSLRRYLVAGVLVWLPILATLWVITFIVSLMDSILLWLPAELPAPERCSAFGFRVSASSSRWSWCSSRGSLVSNLVGRRLVQYWDGVIRRIPLVRSIHGGVKSFAESVFSQSNSFRKVVMIQYPARGRLEHRVHHGRGCRRDSPTRPASRTLASTFRLRPIPRRGSSSWCPSTEVVELADDRGCGHEDDHYLRGGHAAALAAPLG